MAMLSVVTMPVHLEMIIYSLFFVDEDEVGDRITVRSDEEMKAMLSYVSICIPDRFLRDFSKFSELVFLNVALHNYIDFFYNKREKNLSW